MKLFFALVFFLNASLCFGALGLQTKGQSGATYDETLRFQVPSNQLTKVGDKSYLAETGNGNVLVNPSFEHSSGGTGWSSITWSGAPSSTETTAANVHGDGLQSRKIDVSADYSTAFLYQDVTPKGSFKGQLLEHGGWFKTTNLQYMAVCARQGGVTVGVCMPYLNLTGDWEYQYATSVGPAQGTSIGVALIGTAIMTGTGSADEFYVGPLKFEHSPGVSEANWYVDATMDGANPSMGTSGVSSYTEISDAALTLKPQTGTQPVGVMCSGTNAATAPTTSNTTCAAGNESVGINFAIPKPGPYEVCWYGTHFTSVGGGGNVSAGFQLIETPTNAQTLTLEGGSRMYSANNGGSTAGTSAATGLPQTNCSIFNWTASGTKGVRLMFEQSVSAPVNLSLLIGDADAATGQRNMRWTVKPVSNAGFSAQSTNSMRPPTYTILTSGTAATYTTPIGVSSLEIELIGAGGSGASSGTASTADGAAGGTTSFGTSLLTATGGGGGKTGGTGYGAGGTATINSPAVTVANIPGGNGACSSYTSTAITTNQAGSAGGSGASTPFAAGGGGSYAVAGAAGGANTGTGGGGGGFSSVTSSTVIGGCGGAAGGYLRATINAPSAQYTYTIGATGGTTTAGTNGFAGGAGGTGVIRIKEIYGINVPPMKAGVIAQDNPGGVTTINTIVSKTADYTAGPNEETILMDSSSATRTITLPAAASVKGKKYEIVQTSTSNQVIIDGNASETICGSTTIRLSGSTDSVSIQSDGTNWVGLKNSCWVSHSVNGSSGGAVSNELGDWINGNCTNAAPFVCTLMTGVWSVAPQCSGSGSSSASRYFQFVASTSSIAVWEIDASGTSVNNAAWQMTCQGPR